METLEAEAASATETGAPDGLYRVAWRVKATGYEGHGERCLTYSQALEWCRAGNRDYPEMHHWPQSV